MSVDLRTHAALGIAVAVHILLECPQTEQPLPLFDESVYPLGGLALDGSMQGLFDYVLLFAHVLEADAQQLVTALVLFESMLRVRPGSLRLRCTRPMLLATVVVTLKVTLDETLTLSEVTAQLGNITPALTPRHLMRLEGALLTTLG